MYQKGFALPHAVFGFLVVLIISTIAFYLYQQRQPLIDQQLNPSTLEEPSEYNQSEELRTETDKIQNPNSNLAFYYSSEIPAFDANTISDQEHCKDGINPFDICFNGDTFYSIKGSKEEAPHYKYILPYVEDKQQNKKYLLSSLAEIWAGPGFVQVEGWLDNQKLLVKSSVADGPGAEITYYEINAYENKLVEVGSWDHIFDDKVIITIKLYNFTFYQECLDEGSCSNISFYKNLPIGSYSPESIKTSKKMDILDLEMDDNLKTWGKEVKLLVGDGYMVIDLKQGRIIQTEKLLD